MQLLVLDVRIDNYHVTELQLSHVVEDLLATLLILVQVLSALKNNTFLLYDNIESVIRI